MVRYRAWFLASVLFLASAFLTTGWAETPDGIEALEKEYAKLYPPCEECTIGRKRPSQSKACAAKCDKAKKVREKIDQIKKGSAQ